MANKFTQRSVEALKLPAGKAELIVWDPSLPGFGVRVRPTSKAWRIQYRAGKQQRSESLGDVRKVELDAARKIARQRFAAVELGKDPGAERDAARQAQAAQELTFGKVVERYLAAQTTSVAAGSLSASTLKSTKRYLLNYWRPLHGVQIDAVKRGMIAAHLRDFESEHGRMAAGAARKNLSALYSWGMREGLVEGGNPVLGSSNPGAGSRPRDRVLDDHELRIIWKVATEVDDDFGKVVRLCLWTLCRREEIGALRWDEVNLETGRLVLPASRTKNRRAHELDLPEPALEILRSQPRITGRPWVFGRHGAGMSGWSYHKVRFDKFVAEAAERAPAPWTVHDLRRTAATRVAGLTAPHVVEALLNHAKPTLVGTYNLATYKMEKAQALARWAELLAAIVEGRDSNVVTLPQRA